MYELSEEQKMLQQTVRQLAKEKVERDDSQNTQNQEGKPQSEAALTQETEGQSRQVASERKL